MLELIVLGQIPGTHFEITFRWALAAIQAFLLCAGLMVLLRAHQAAKSAEQQNLEAISL